MKKIVYILLLIGSTCTYGQSDIDVLLKDYNTRSIPYISVQELEANLDQYLILDTRKKEEYNVSHIPGSFWVSEKVNDSLLAQIFSGATLNSTRTKDTPIVLYCSVGIRSEDFGDQLKTRGFTNIQNLYGSIFAWKDEGYELVNSQKQKTDSVHVFSKIWGKYLKTGTKVY